MPINRVDMYQAVCDACGNNPSSDYWAWADEAQARDEWADSDFGITLDSGEVYCWDCVPAEVCRYAALLDGDYKHTPSDEDPAVCAECDAPIPAGATP